MRVSDGVGDDPGAPRLGWIVAAAVAVLLITVTALAIGHRGGHARASSAGTTPTTTAPPPTATARATRTTPRPTTAHPTSKRRTSTARHTTPPPAPTHVRAGAVAVVPSALAHPPPAARVVPLTAASEEVGLVDVVSTLGFQNEIAEGTGMLLTSTGAVLTNNHVIRDATSISVIVINTGTTYRASVIGTDPSADVAVLQLTGSPHTQVAPFGDSATVTVGAAVTAVGNAGGKGGTPTAAPGEVTALHQSITATDENGANAEHLTDLIASNAQIQPGDSGGPLFDAHGRVVGMDTAGGRAANGEIVAFSIPIDSALSIAGQIQRGQASSTVHIGTPAFLGVQTSDSPAGNGAVVQRVLAGTPAAAAGLRAGDAISDVGGRAVTSAASLDAALAAHKPGDVVQLTWTRPGVLGAQTLNATVTLAAGPPD